MHARMHERTWKSQFQRIKKDSSEFGDKLKQDEQTHYNQRKTNKLDFINMKSFYASKCIIKKVKRQSTESKNIFANYIPDTCPVFRTYKELLQLDN